MPASIAVLLPLRPTTTTPSPATVLLTHVIPTSALPPRRLMRTTRVRSATAKVTRFSAESAISIATRWLRATWPSIETMWSPTCRPAAAAAPNGPSSETMTPGSVGWFLTVISRRLGPPLEAVAWWRAEGMRYELSQLLDARSVLRSLRCPSDSSPSTSCDDDVRASAANMEERSGVEKVLPLAAGRSAAGDEFERDRKAGISGTR